MALGGKFEHYESPEFDCQILSLPYKNDLSTMYIIMPNNSSAKRLKELHRRLTAESINDMISKVSLKSAIVFVPKMHLTSEINFNEFFQNYALFNPEASDLGLISNGVEAILTNTAGAAAATAGLLDNHRNLLHMAVQDEPSHNDNLENVLLFSRIQDDNEDMEAKVSRKRRTTYKVDSQSRTDYQPLRLKDLVLNKRIVKESKTKKKPIRQRRDTSDPNLLNLEALRQSQTTNPGLYASEILHKVDLTINEKGTEGGAATTVTLYKTGPDVVFRAEEPFIFLIRHESSQLPLFYGQVFDPRP